MDAQQVEQALGKLSERWGAMLLDYLEKDRKVNARLDGRRAAASTLVFRFELQRASDVDRLLTLSEPMALALKVPNVRLSRQLGYYVVEVPLPPSLRRPVPFARVADVPGRGLAVPLGVSGLGRVVGLDLSQPETPHCLIAGSTGCGKTVLAQTLALQLVKRNRPGDLGLLLLDVKRKPFVPFANVPHLLHPVVTDTDEMLEVLQWVVDEMDRRTGQARHKPVVVVIDEVADGVMSTGGRRGVFAKLLARIASRGREHGFALVGGTQYVTAEVVGELLKTNIPTRLVGSVGSASDSALIAGTPEANAQDLLGRGDFVRVVAGGQAVRFQAAMPDLSDFGDLPYTSSVPRLPLPGVHVEAEEGGIDAQVLAEWMKLRLAGGASGVQALVASAKIGAGRAGRHVRFGQKLESALEERGVGLCRSMPRPEEKEACDGGMS